MLRKISSLILLITLGAGTLAQSQSGTGTVDVARLRADVTYLASDKLEGRRTGTPGAAAAAEYIAGEFKRLGLKPGASDAGLMAREKQTPYIQRFPFIAGVRLGPQNSMRLSMPATNDSGNEAVMELRAGEDWMPLGFSMNGQVEKGEIVFAGYGIKASDLKHDDYSGGQVRGRIALVLSGTPDGDNPHGQFARYEGVRWKAIAARDAGAKALVIVARDEKFKDDRLSLLRYDNSAGDAGIPVVVISRQAASRILVAGGLPALGQLQTAQSQPAGNGTLLKNVALTIGTDVVRQKSPAGNVIGVLEGIDPVLKSQAIVLGAHYDHLGIGGEGSLAPREGEIHHGADDNASGVAGLLELARILSAGPRPKRTIVFIAFSGEEEGLLGSNYYVNHPVVPLANTIAMINMDMIGRMRDGKLMVGGVGTAKEWRDILGRVPMTSSHHGVAAPAGAPLNLVMNEDGFGPSDHSSFYGKQVPVLFMFTGTHDDYHKPSDTADKIDYSDQARIVALVNGVVRALDANSARPTYAVAKSEAGRSTGFRVYLGTIPNYADGQNGLLLDGVRDDSPASKAGLKAGDRITKLAGKEIKNVYDYTYVLGEMKAGMEYDVEAVRGSETLRLKIVPAARR